MHRYRFVFLYVVFCFICNWAICQTYYYQQIKIVKNNVEKSGDNTGQFITFTPNACYDSDKKGYSVNNGVLKYTSRKGNIYSYSGSSYWGEAHYFVSLKRDRINIRVADGTVYVYERRTPPNGVNNSSKIRSKKNASSNASYPVLIDVSSNFSLPQNSKDASYKQVLCSFCNGSGKNPVCDYPPQFTGEVKSYQYCPICKATKEVHSHGVCPSCNGKKYNTVRTY